MPHLCPRLRPAEWLRCDTASKHRFRVDTATGNRLWARYCIKLLTACRSEPGTEMDSYSLKHVVGHAIAAQDWGARNASARPWMRAQPPPASAALRLSAIPSAVLPAPRGC